MKFEDLSGFAQAAMNQLFMRGPTWDGDITSKAGRGELVANGLAFHDEGWASLTARGVAMAVAAPVRGWADQRWYRKQNNLPEES